MYSATSVNRDVGISMDDGLTACVFDLLVAAFGPAGIGLYVLERNSIVPPCVR